MSGTLKSDLEIEYYTRVATDEAEATDDFIAISMGTPRTATISAESLTTTIEIEIEDDNANEGNEYFDVVVNSDPTNFVFDTGVTDLYARIHIIDDEPPTLQIANLTDATSSNPVDYVSGATFEVDENVNGNNLVIRFTITGSTTDINPNIGEDVVIGYTTSLKTTLQGDPSEGAAEQDDFTAQYSQTVTIPAESASLMQTIQIPITDDSIWENDEDFTLTLESIDNAVFAGTNVTSIPITVDIIENDAKPTLSIANTEYNETNKSISVAETAGTLVLEFEIADPPSEHEITFNYRLTNGTAEEGSGKDFTGPTSDMGEMIMSGTSGRLEIPILDDILYEGDETFTVTFTLNDPTNIDFATGLAGGVVTVTITDNEVVPTLTVVDKMVSADEGGGNAVIALQLSPNQVQADVTVQYDVAVGGGDATGGASVMGTSDVIDFKTETNKVFTIPGGNSSQSIMIPIGEDTVYEGNETFHVTIDTIANATFGDDDSGTAITEIPVTVTILENDNLPTLTAPASMTVGEEDGNVNIEVTLTPGTDENTRVNYEVITGSATESDFTQTPSTPSGNVMIDAKTERDSGVSPTHPTAQISIPIYNDEIKEIDESFIVKITLNSPSGKARIDSVPQEIFVPVTITDNDVAATLPVIKLSANTTQPTEADSSENGSNFAVQFEIDEETANTVAVDYTIAGDSAILGEDFMADSSGTAFITAGKTAKIAIPIIDDVMDEDGETFTITISNPQNAMFATPEVAADKARTFTIADNDSTPALSVMGSPTTLNVVEGESADIGLVLGNPAKADVVVSYTITSGSNIDDASSGDYNDTNGGSITLAKGTTFKTLSIGAAQDTDYEDDEDFTVTFTAATNVSNTDASGISAIVVTIIDEESVSTLTADASVSVMEGSGGTTNATINLSLSPDSTTNTTVLYSTVDGSAKAGTDFTAAINESVPINTGADSGSFNIVISPDSVDEDDEIFYVDITIQNPGSTRAKINGDTIRVPVTITDDDNAPSIALTDPQPTTTLNEGDTLNVPLTLVGATSNPVSVAYTIGGTATANVDFIDTESGVASITSGQTGSISIPIIDDSLFDENETIIITLANTATNASVGTNKSHTFTITDNDMRPELSTPAITVKEDIGTGKYPLILNHPATQSFDVRISAIDWPDLTIAQQTITFAPGELVKSFDFTIIDDNVYEPGARGELQELEIISILNSPSFVHSAAQSFTSTGIIYIVDNDVDSPLPVLSAPKSLSFVEGQASPSVPLVLSSAATGTVEVTYSILAEAPDNTATGGSNNTDDFATASGSMVEITSGTTGSIGLTIRDDTVFEGNEKFRVKLTAVSGARFPGGENEIVIPVTIVDNEQKPILSVSTPSLEISEGGSGVINYSLSNATTEDVVITFTGTGSDGFGVPDGLSHDVMQTIDAGDTVGSNTVRIGNDDEFEGVERVSMRITVNNAAVIPESAGNLYVPVTVNDTDGPIISVVSNSLGVNEPASGTSTVNVMVQLNRPAVEDTTINYYTDIVSGTDTADTSDFVGIDSSSKSDAMIMSGSTTANIPLTINAETGAGIDTVDETFTLHLDVATSAKARFGSGNSDTATTATVNIIDANTTQVSFTNTIVSANEGDAIEFPFTVSPVASSSNTVTLALAFAQVGTTVAGDYSDTHSGSISLDGTSGEATKISINTTEDNVVELDEEFTITVTATGAVLNNGTNSITLTGIITNDDTRADPTFTIGTITATETSGKATINYTIAGLHDGVTLNYETAVVASGATAGSDFIAQTGKSFTIATANSASEAYSIEIPVFNDDIVEGDESFNITFSSSDITIGTATHTVTILDDDDDTAPTLTASLVTSTASISALSVDEGVGKAQILLTLNKALDENLVLAYMFGGNSATGGTLSTPGVDYDNTTTSITFNAGEISKLLEVPINSDDVYENSGTAETFTITFTANSALSSLPGVITVSINEDDADAVFVVSFGDSFVFDEKSTDSAIGIPFTVSRAPDSAISVALTPMYTSGAGNASANDITITTTQTIAIGETSGNFELTIDQDDLYEGTETFNLQIAVTGATISPSNNTSKIISITIVDEDAIPVVTVENDTHSVGEDDDTNIPLKLTGKSEHVITVNLITTPVTASDSGVGADYVPSLSTTIGAEQTGDSAGSIAITVEPDSVSDGGETFIVQITSVSGASIDANGLRPITVTITDPDPELKVAAFPTVSSGRSTVDEGDEFGFDFSLVSAGTTTAVNTGKPVTISYTVGKSGDGAESDDYEGTAMTSYKYTFTSGSSGMIRIPTIDDLINEGDHEDFIITITDVTGATLANTPIEYMFRITDDDSDPTFRLLANTVVVTERDSNNVSASVDYELSHESLTDITVNHSITLGSTEAEDFDYVDRNASSVTTSTITKGDTSGTITFLVKGDTIYEGDENFSTTVTVSGATLTGNGLVNFTIIEDDDKPTISLLTAARTESVNEGSNTDIKVKVTGTSEHDIDLTYEAIPGTARVSDYGTPSTITITAGTTPGDQAVTIALNTMQDDTYEGNENFQIRLTNADDADIDADGLKPINVTIIDNTPPALSVTPATSVMEGNSAVFTFNLVDSTDSTRMINAGLPVTVTYNTTKADSAGTDDFITPGTELKIVGGSSGTITIPTIDDDIFEGDESFTLSITDVDNATLTGLAPPSTPVEYQVTITDSDTIPTLTVSTPTIRVVEPDQDNSVNAEITLTLDNPVDGAFSIQAGQPTGSTANAAESNDFGTPSTLSVAATNDSLTHTITIPIVGDNVYEDDEVFTSELTLASGASFVSFTTTTVTVTIVENELSPVISVTDTTISVTEGSPVEFMVELSPPSEEEVTVQVRSTDGSAVSTATGSPVSDPRDFTAHSSTVTFASTTGRTDADYNDAAPISIATDNDDFKEDVENFAITLDTPNNAKFAGSKTSIDIRATINDNDGDSTVTAELEMNMDNTMEGGTEEIELTLDKMTAHPVVVTYSTSLDTYTPLATYPSQDNRDDGENPAEDSDFSFTTTDRMVTFAPRELTKTISFTIPDDVGNETFEGTESFTFNIDSVSGANRGTESVRVTIDEQESAPAVTVDPVNVDTSSVMAETGGTSRDIVAMGLSVHEDVASGNVEIPLDLSLQTEHVVVVRYSVLDESTPSAAEDVDFDSTSDDSGGVRMVRFMPGETKQKIEVPIINDIVYEGDETFTISVLSYQIGHFAQVDLTGQDITITIIDDDNDDVPILRLSQTSIVADEEVGDLNVEFKITKPTKFPVVIEYFTAVGGADADDFDDRFIGTPLTGTRGTAMITATPSTLNAENLTANIVIPITPDDIYEDNETFTVTISRITSMVPNASPAITTARFDRGLSGVSAEVIIPNSEAEPYDQLSYDPIPTLSVDTSIQGVEPARPEVPADPQVPNSGMPAMPITVVVAENIAEGVAVIPLKLTGRHEDQVSVRYSTSIESTDTAETNDFNRRVNQTAVISKAGRTGEIKIPIVSDLDQIFEDNETFTVTLSMPENAVFGASATEIVVQIVITDPIGAPILSIDTEADHVTPATATDPIMVSVLESDEVVNIPVKISHRTTEDVVVNFTTSKEANDSASTSVGEVDFTAGDGTEDILSLATAGMISVEINDDDRDEINETFTLTITGADNASLEGATSIVAIVTIVDDDIPVISVESTTEIHTETDADQVVNFTLVSDRAPATALAINYIANDPNPFFDPSDTRPNAVKPSYLEVGVAGVPLRTDPSTITFSETNNRWVATLPLTFKGDRDPDLNGSVVVMLLDQSPAPVDYQVATGDGASHSVYVIDNDAPSGTNAKSISIASPATMADFENAPAQFILSTGMDPERPLAIRYTPVNGTLDSTGASNNDGGDFFQTATPEMRETIVNFTDSDNDGEFTAILPVTFHDDNFGEKRAPITVTLEDDVTVAGEDATYSVSATNNSAVAIVIDDDAPELYVSDGGEEHIGIESRDPKDPGYALFPVTASIPPTKALNIVYTPTSSAALGTVDFLNESAITDTSDINSEVNVQGQIQTTPPSIEYAVNSKVANIPVRIQNDDLVEADGSITIVIAEQPVTTDPAGIAYSLAPTDIGTPTGTTVVRDDDTANIIIGSIEPVVEGDRGPANAEFPVTLDKMSEVEIKVNYEVSIEDGDTASLDDDFVPITSGESTTDYIGEVTFAPLSTSEIARVQIQGDTVFETRDDETFSVTLSEPRSNDPATPLNDAAIEVGTVKGAIENDDTPSQLPEISIVRNMESVEEGETITFNITSFNLDLGAIDLDLSVVQNGNFLLWRASRSINQFNEDLVVLEIKTHDDHIDEPDGSVTVTLHNTSQYVSLDGSNTATVAIRDNDLPGQQELPRISVASAAVNAILDYLSGQSGPPAAADPVIPTVSIQAAELIVDEGGIASFRVNSLSDVAGTSILLHYK